MTRRPIAFVFAVASLAFVASCDQMLAAIHGGGGQAVAPPPSTAAATPTPNAEGGAVVLAADQAPATDAAPAAPAHARFTVDTPLAEIIANPQAKAIVDHYTPGITEGPHAAMAGAFSLRQIKAQMGDMISDAELEQMSRELAAIR